MSPERGVRSDGEKAAERYARRECLVKRRECSTMPSLPSSLSQRMNWVTQPAAVLSPSASIASSLPPDARALLVRRHFFNRAEAFRRE